MLSPRPGAAPTCGRRLALECALLSTVWLPSFVSRDAWEAWPIYLFAVRGAFVTFVTFVLKRQPSHGDNKCHAMHLSTVAVVAIRSRCLLCSMRSVRLEPLDPGRLRRVAGYFFACGTAYADSQWDGGVGSHPPVATLATLASAFSSRP